jgi:hypothetical protein
MPRNNLNQVCERSAQGKQKPLKKTIEDGKISHSYGLVESSENGYITKRNLHVQCNCNQNSNEILFRD